MKHLTMRTKTLIESERIPELQTTGKMKFSRPFCFFIEAGAWEFTNASNTLRYELKHNWTGLLIEPVQERCQEGWKVNRKAWSSCSCISTFTKPR